MVKNQLREVEKNLRWIAKRNRNISFSIGLVLLYVMLGMNAFAQEVNATIATKQEIGLSTDRLSEMLRRIKEENSKKLKGTQLELVQLMEQGDQVVKSPWASWQFGMNYMYNNWSKAYKGRGDKAKRYPYEGIFTRSNDLFLRFVSPDSDAYTEYTALSTENFAHPATTSAIKKQRKNYGLEEVTILQEPIRKIELAASVKPKEIVKNPVTVIPPKMVVNPVMPLNTPREPNPPTPPVIAIEKFNPVAPDPITVSLPTPPTFNIKLGSYRNYMRQLTLGNTDGGRHTGDGLSYDTSNDKIVTATDLGTPTVVYAWKSPSSYVAGANFDSALLKVFFDYTNFSSGNGGKTARVEGDITIDSIRGNIVDSDTTARPWNNQAFLVGGSRVATLDNATKNGATIVNVGTVNLVGPLVVGYEIQNDDVGRKKREIRNEGTITDKAEEGYRGIEGLGGLKVENDPTNPPTNPNELELELFLAPNLGGNLTGVFNQPGTGINLKRTKDIHNSDGTVTKGGYLGYKIGLILTHEYDDPSPSEDLYKLANASGGKISFTGKNSIGIQVFAPPKSSPNTKIEVENAGNMNLAGTGSYGLKVSSRILPESKIENKSGGKIIISGGNGQENSLSSGIAIIEDKVMSTNKSIRAYKDMIINKGTINVSGGQGNTGMVLITKANDNITNDTTGTINVTGTKNIGMRVDLGNVTTEESGTLTPEAINKGTINITAGDQNIGMVANKKDISGNKAVAMNTNSIRFFGEASKAIGMFASNGGEIVNNKDIKYDTIDLLETIGLVVNDKDSIGKNTGDISLNGTRVTGVYNRGSFEMTDGSITTSGAKSISLYSSGVNSKTEIKNGKIRAEGGALGLFADNNATVQLGDSADVNKKVVLEADGAGTLLFYNYTKSGTTYTSDGKFKINNENVVTGKLINGATAFYFKDTTPGKGSGQTSDKLNAMFNGSNNNKIKLELDDKSTLFVLDNTNSNTDYIPLSSVDINSINDFLGKNVEINTSLSSRNFKAYKATKASLSINSDIDLDNHSSTTIDKYYRVDFMNSNVRVETGKKITGSDSSIRDIAIAQANFDSATRNDSVKVTNKGNIEFSKKGATGIVVDYAQGINEGTIKMDAANSTGENSIAMFGASGSKLENTTNGTIELGTNGVGIWGANKISSSILTWSKNIDIANAGKIKGINGKSGIFGIYANNDITTHSGATSILSHSGTIDLSQNIKSTGIFMKNGILTSTGNIFVKEASVAVNATDSTVNVSGGTYIVGKESLGFKLTATSSGTLPVFNGIGGNINMTESGSVAYLLEGGTYNSGLGNNFIDNLALTSTNGYTYINVKNATLNYRNTKAINNDETIFVNSNATILELMNGTNLSSTKQKVTGIYATNGGSVDNAGKITLIGDNSSAMYATKDTITNVSTSLKNKNTGNIEVGKNGSAMYAIGSNAENEGMMTVGSGSVGMRTEGGILQNKLSGSISSTGVKVLGMSQSTGGNITNEGVITLTGDQSIGMQSEKATISGHEIKNTGSITVGDSSSATTPSIGIYSANDINSKIINSKKVIAGNKSIGIYGKEIELGANSETSAGDAGIAVYSNKGLVTIQNVAKLKIGKSLGENQEGVAVYLAGDAQNLERKTSTVTIGNGSFGYVMTGQGNTITTGLLGNTEVISLGKDSMFLYSADKTGSITNYNHLKSIGDKNYGLYVSGAAENKGNIDFSVGIGNVGIYSYLKGAIAGTKPGLVQNYGEIKVSKSDISDPNHRKYGIGMAAGFTEEEPIGSGTKVLRGTGNIKNEVGGVIKVTDENSIGMYATGKGSVAENAGRIELSGNNRNIGMFIEEGAEGINTGTITTVGSGNKKQIGIAVMSGGILDNRGNIHIDAEDGYGILLAGAIIKNYGTFEITPEKYAEDKAGVENVLNFNQITAGSGAQKLKIIGATDMTKEMGDMGLDKIKIDAPAGIANATITVNGVVQKPVIADVQAIPNRVPNKIPTSSVGMYVDTSGINYTKPITNIGKLVGLTEADLIIGTEATNYTNGKYIQLSQEMIEPYNDMIRTSGIEKWSIYSGALTWMASITQLPDFSIRNAYLAKIPYTVFANDKNTTRDIYNFADGLEQRYGVEKIGARENQLFQKLNRIGNNEEILLHQAYDEMMGHQYANVQQRIQATSSILDKELKYLKKEWDTKSKDS
ncbi:hypothetical protein FUSO3_11760, partial [Fusobacterium necrophorum BL]